MLNYNGDLFTKVSEITEELLQPQITIYCVVMFCFMFELIKKTSLNEDLRHNID